MHTLHRTPRRMLCPGTAQRRGHRAAALQAAPPAAPARHACRRGSVPSSGGVSGETLRPWFTCKGIGPTRRVLLPAGSRAGEPNTSPACKLPSGRCSAAMPPASLPDRNVQRDPHEKQSAHLAGQPDAVILLPAAQFGCGLLCLGEVVVEVAASVFITIVSEVDLEGGGGGSAGGRWHWQGNAKQQ